MLASASVLPNSAQQTIATPRLKIPRAIKDINREYKDFNIDTLVELKKKVRNLDIYCEDDSDVLGDVEDALQRFNASLMNIENLKS